MASNTSTQKSEPVGFTPFRVIRVVIFIGLMAAILFGAAGRLNWFNGWVYIGMYVATTVYGVYVSILDKPDLVDERVDVPEDAKKWDRWLTSILIPVTLLGPLVVGGLDARFGWTMSLPLWTIGAGLALYLIGYLLGQWAVSHNKFYSRVVRIQTDRGHVPVTTGPYAIVRHPGYVGAFLNMLGIPLILGSLWTFVISAVTILALIVRTYLEDQTLQNELPGYTAYTQKTRYRLIPGIW